MYRYPVSPQPGRSADLCRDVAIWAPCYAPILRITKAYGEISAEAKRQWTSLADKWIIGEDRLANQRVDSKRQPCRHSTRRTAAANHTRSGLSAHPKYRVITHLCTRRLAPGSRTLQKPIIANGVYVFRNIPPRARLAVMSLKVLSGSRRAYETAV